MQQYLQQELFSSYASEPENKENSNSFNIFMLCFLLLTKEKCNLKVEEEVFVEAKNGDASLLSISMAEEEEKLLKSRMKEEEIEKAAEAQLDESQFNNLDQLLTQTKLYSEFLLEKIDQITAVCIYLLE